MFLLGVLCLCPAVESRKAGRVTERWRSVSSFLPMASLALQAGCDQSMGLNRVRMQRREGLRQRERNRGNWARGRGGVWVATGNSSRLKGMDLGYYMKGFNCSE